MRRALLFSAAIAFAIACGDNITEPVPDRTVATPPVAFATTTTEDGLSISTDLDDYAPGDTVHFTGSGWQPGDVLDIVLVDEPQTHDPHTWSVDVGEDGTFHDSTYVVDTGDLGVTFTLTATSRATGRSLTVTFTDGNVRVKSAPDGVQFTLGRKTYTAAGCTGTETSLSSVTATSTLTTVATAGGPGNPVSVKLTAASTSTLGAAFIAWSTLNGSTFAIVGGDPKVICVAGGSGNLDFQATYNAAPDLELVKSASGAFTVGSSGTYSIEVKNTGTASASGESQNRITVTDALPTGLTPPAAFSQNSWDCTIISQTVTCRLATGQLIAPGASRTFDITVGVTAAACPSVTNSATVGGGNEPAGKVDAKNTGSTTTNIGGCNTGPTAEAGGPYTGNEGSAVSLSGASATGTATPLTYKWTYVAGATVDAGTTCSFSPSDAVLNPSITCTDDGAFTLTLTVTDNDNKTASDNATLTLQNVKPTATAGGPYSDNEGAAIQLSGSGDDPGDNDDPYLTFLWTVNTTGIDAGGSCQFYDPANPASAGTATSTLEDPTIKCTDDSNLGTFTLSLVATDDDGGVSVASTATLTVANVAPILGAITAPVAPVNISMAVNVSAPFTDQGTNDTHTGLIDWGDGTTSAAVITESSGSGTASGSHLYSETGVYTITMTVTDDDGGVSNQSIFQYVVVYDPSAGFVTGGGWINSLAGFCKLTTACESAQGKANFGFVSKYLKATSTVPSGNTEFQFKAGNFNFNSESYEWLLVNQSGTNAQYKGSGTINGVSGYKFMLWATDGAPTGGYDTFRIKIWRESATGDVVAYDNMVTGGGGYSTVPIAGGSIVIHTNRMATK